MSRFFRLVRKIWNETFRIAIWFQIKASEPSSALPSLQSSTRNSEFTASSSSKVENAKVMIWVSPTLMIFLHFCLWLTMENVLFMADGTFRNNLSPPSSFPSQFFSKFGKLFLSWCRGLLTFVSKKWTRKESKMPVLMIFSSSCRKSRKAQVPRPHCSSKVCECHVYYHFRHSPEPDAVEKEEWHLI